jgi:hypothetical protein
MQPPDGDVFYLRGEFRTVDPPAHLSYTFRWKDPDRDDRETIVVLSLTDLGESTELVVDQAPFVTEARRALYLQGWTVKLLELGWRSGRTDYGETPNSRGDNSRRYVRCRPAFSLVSTAFIVRLFASRGRGFESHRLHRRMSVPGRCPPRRRVPQSPQFLNFDERNHLGSGR